MKLTIKLPWWIMRHLVPRKTIVDLERRSVLTGEASLGGNYLKGALSAHIKYGHEKDGNE